MKNGSVTLVCLEKDELFITDRCYPHCCYLCYSLSLSQPLSVLSDRFVHALGNFLKIRLNLMF